MDSLRKVDELQQAILWQQDESSGEDPSDETAT
jgi:hypothetical protein